MRAENYNIDLIRNRLKEVLSQKRYLHSIGTEQKALELAEQFGVDRNKAAIAGLLHDCAKFIKKEQMLDFIKDNNIKIFGDSVNAPSILHAYVSEYLAKHDYGINDPDILSAIRNHTLGDINMTDLDKIVFIADKIEDNTRHEDYFEEIRNTLKKTNCLNEAILISYAQTIKGLVDKNYYINQITIRNWNYLLEQTGYIKPIIKNIGLYKKI